MCCNILCLLMCGMTAYVMLFILYLTMLMLPIHFHIWWVLVQLHSFYPCWRSRFCTLVWFMKDLRNLIQSFYAALLGLCCVGQFCVPCQWSSPCRDDCSSAVPAKLQTSERRDTLTYRQHCWILVCYMFVRCTTLAIRKRYFLHWSLRTMVC